MVQGHYDDIQVCASKTASGNLIQQVLPYDTVSNTQPYHPQYLAGYQAECYTIDGEEGFKVAQTYIDRDQRSLAESDIRGKGYSQAQVTGMNTSYQLVRYKHVLLPLWKAKYGYGGQTYHYMINGENGKVSAQYPKSKLKIILVILLVLALIIGGVVLLGDDSSGGSGGYEYSYNGSSDYDYDYDYGGSSYDYDYDYGGSSYDSGGSIDYGSYDYGYDWGGD